jgi:hypothetical protein
MSEKGKKESPTKKINERDRLRYIGFDVFPGEPADLFKSEAEKNKLVEEVRERREHHDHLRGECTLLEERVSGLDRIVLTIGSIIIILALFLPWYAVYNEIVEESVPIEEVEPPVNVTGATEPVGTTTPTDTLGATAEQVASDTALAATEAAGSAEPTEELITTVMARKKITKVYERVSGIGSIIAIGSVGSKVFSSGLALMLTAVLYLAFTLLCIALPIYNLYGIYGLKGDTDVKALKLKKMLRLNWIPLGIFVAGLFLSFFGDNYSFNAAETFTSLGESYSPLVYLGTVSWGVFVSLACFVLCAAKGVEI